ncbi:hypothetical protein GZL_02466 [Streptomyces sp. 769]|nr:hypothetical protein GZL_02466 [Streptomyces sp. 769]
MGCLVDRWTFLDIKSPVSCRTARDSPTALPLTGTPRRRETDT